MWDNGSGGNPGPIDFEGNLLKGSRGVESYFGGLQKIMVDKNSLCEVRLGRGQHNLQGSRSYLSLYPTATALGDWLRPAVPWDTFTDMGLFSIIIVTIIIYCHNNILHVVPCLSILHCDTCRLFSYLLSL